MKTLCWPTNALYRHTSDEAYFSEKEAFLLEKNKEYKNLSVEAQWKFLIQIFSTEPLDPIAIRFGERRGDNRYVLNLEQCVAYFEHFYFIYHQAGLSSSAQQEMLTTLKEAMSGVCETGVNERFIQIMTLYSRRGHWIEIYLRGARRQILDRIVSQYVRHRNISEGMQVHYTHCMIKLAKKLHLGLESVHAMDIEDVHEDLINVTDAKAFFNAQLPTFFKDYEANIVSDLVHDCLLAVKKIVPLDHTVALDTEQVNQLAGFLEARFGNVQSMLFICEEREEAAAGCYHLKRDEEVKQGFRSLVIQALKDRGYYHPIDVVMDEKADIHLKPHMTLESLRLVRDQIQGMGLVHGLTTDIMQAYPQLVVNDVNLIFRLPRHIKYHPAWVQGIAPLLNQVLSDIIRQDVYDQEELQNSMRQCFECFQSDDSYASLLSKEILDHPGVRQVLRREKPKWMLWIGNMADDDQIFRDYFGSFSSGIHYSRENYLDDVYKNMLNGLPPRFHVMRSDRPMSYEDKVKHCLRVRALYLLLLPRVSAEICMTELEYLNPALLLEIMDYRQSERMSPLPIWQHPIIQKNLRRFKAEIEAVYENDAQCWLESWQNMRENLLGQHNRHTLLASLSVSGSWIHAFQYYHVNGSFLYTWTRHRGLNLLNHTRDLMYHLGVIILNRLMYQYVVPFLTTLVAPWWLLRLQMIVLLLCVIGCYHLCFHKRPWVENAYHVAFSLLLLDWMLWIDSLFGMIKYTWYALSSLIGLGKLLIEHMVDVFQSACDMVESIRYKSSLEDACEITIFRLEGLEAPSAHEKASVLKNILEQARHDYDAQDIPMRRPLKSYLHQLYPVQNGQEVQYFSFYQVAQMPRMHQTHFELKAPPAWHLRLFKGRTTSEATLSHVLGSERLGVEAAMP